MKYYATIDDQTYEISIDRTGQIVVGGVELAVDMKRIGSRQLYSLLLDSVSHEIAIEVDAEQRNVYDVMVGGQRYDVKVQDERSRRLSLIDRNLKPPDGELIVKAPIPGLVVKVPVAPGQAVAEGEPVLILEAMKMENELRAPRAGVVHEVRVAPRMQVAQGQVLLTIR